MIDILDILKQNADDVYADFQVKLTPTIKREDCIGVRVPIVRKIARQIKCSNEAQSFINTLPHKYYDEYMLHGLLVSEIKDYNVCIKYLDEFLPYVDNWAVCDIISPKILGKYKDKTLININKWVRSSHTFTVRFGLKTLMTYYLDKDFKKEYLEIPSKITSDEYYVNMMIAWFFATALAKQWKNTILYIENETLPPWVHNKTIQKAVESYRITEDQKLYLKSLKMR